MIEIAAGKHFEGNRKISTVRMQNMAGIAMNQDLRYQYLRIMVMLSGIMFSIH